MVGWTSYWTAGPVDRPVPTDPDYSIVLRRCQAKKIKRKTPFGLDKLSSPCYSNHMLNDTFPITRPATIIREFDGRTDKGEDIVAYFHVRTGTVIGVADLAASPYRGDAMRPLVIG